MTEQTKQAHTGHIHLLSILSILAAGSLWGSMGIFVRRFSSWGLASMQMVALRSILAVLFLGIFLLIRDRSLLKIRPKDIWCFVGTGIISIVFFSFCYYTTIQLTDLSVAAVMLYTAPAMVMIMSAILFHEKFTPVKVLAILLAFAGCVMAAGILGSSIHLTFFGFLTGLGSGFGYALYSIFSRFALERGYRSMTITFYTFAFAALAVTWFIHPLQMLQTVCADGGRICFTLAYGLLSTVIPYILYTWGLQHVENSMASILASIEPVVAALIGVFLFQENMSLPELIGVILVLASILICNLPKRKQPADSCP